MLYFHIKEVSERTFSIPADNAVEAFKFLLNRTDNKIIKELHYHQIIDMIEEPDGE